MYHGDMINGTAYQCVNVAKRRQIAAPRHFKRAHRGSISVENPRASEKTRQDYLDFPRSRRESLPYPSLVVPMYKGRAETTEKYCRSRVGASTQIYGQLFIGYIGRDVAARNFSSFHIKLSDGRTLSKILIEINSTEKIKLRYSWNSMPICISLIIYL